MTQVVDTQSEHKVSSFSEQERQESTKNFESLDFSSATAEEADPDVKDQSEESSPKTEATEDNQKPEKAKGVQARISELTRLRRESEREAAKLQDEVKMLKEKLSASKKPDVNSYTKGDEYLDAVLDFKSMKTKSEDLDKALNEKTVKAQEKLKEEFAEKSQIFSESTPDYFETLKNLPEKIFDDRLAYNIMSSDSSAEVCYYLAKNLDVAVKMSDMSDIELARALAKLEAKLEYEAQPKEETKTVAKVKAKTSAAEEPITPIKQSEKSAISMSLEEASKAGFSTYEKVRSSSIKSNLLNW